MVNAHTHLYSGLVGFGVGEISPPPQGLIDALTRLWWRLDRAIDESILRASARYYIADALLHGTTVIIDHHESPNLIDGSLDILADTCEQLGMRAVLCYGATERNGGRAEAQRGLAECRRFIRVNGRPLVRGVVGLHASFTVSDDTIREAGQICRECDTVLHVHAAEDSCDVHDARARGYRGVLDRLVSLEALPAGSILAHGVHLTTDEVASARSLGCWLVQNPRSNEANQVGYARALGRSSFVALGTDGFPSDMRAEHDALLRLAAVHGERFETASGRLAAGRRLAARLFGDPVPSPIEHEVPAGAGYMRDVPAAARPLVDRLTIAGRTVVEDGRLLTGDWNEVREEAAFQAARLRDRMGAL
jgi:cytosine/adenosine deaminase-related metal-dependent hydrolase